jgi:hypothetical protein
MVAPAAADIALVPLAACEAGLFNGDLETRVFALQRGTPLHATTEEVSD